MIKYVNCLVFFVSMIAIGLSAENLSWECTNEQEYDKMWLRSRQELKDRLKVENIYSISNTPAHIIVLENIAKDELPKCIGEIAYKSLTSLGSKDSADSMIRIVKNRLLDPSLSTGELNLLLDSLSSSGTYCYEFLSSTNFSDNILIQTKKNMFEKWRTDVVLSGQMSEMYANVLDELLIESKKTELHKQQLITETYKLLKSKVSTDVWLFDTFSSYVYKRLRIGEYELLYCVSEGRSNGDLLIQKFAVNKPNTINKDSLVLVFTLTLEELRKLSLVPTSEDYHYYSLNGYYASESNLYNRSLNSCVVSNFQWTSSPLTSIKHLESIITSIYTNQPVRFIWPSNITNWREIPYNWGVTTLGELFDQAMIDSESSTMLKYSFDDSIVFGEYEQKLISYNIIVYLRDENNNKVSNANFQVYQDYGVTSEMIDKGCFFVQLYIPFDVIKNDSLYFVKPCQFSRYLVLRIESDVYENAKLELEINFNPEKQSKSKKIYNITLKEFNK
ncbi:MAG: hypothetical protein PF692_11690 [Kiritimatiellae bacterium]|nr:hypothetical protein [Kiritimatiellia bacterium]